MGGISPAPAVGSSFPYYFVWMSVGTVSDTLGPIANKWGTIPAKYQSGWTNEWSSAGICQLALNSDLAAILHGWDFFPLGETSGPVLVTSEYANVDSGYDYAVCVFVGGTLTTVPLDFIFIGI